MGFKETQTYIESPVDQDTLDAFKNEYKDVFFYDPTPSPYRRTFLLQRYQQFTLDPDSVQGLVDFGKPDVIGASLKFTGQRVEERPQDGILVRHFTSYKGYRVELDTGDDFIFPTIDSTIS